MRWESDWRSHTPLIVWALGTFRARAASRWRLARSGSGRKAGIFLAGVELREPAEGRGELLLGGELQEPPRLGGVLRELQALSPEAAADRTRPGVDLLGEEELGLGVPRVGGLAEVHRSPRDVPGRWSERR